MNGYVPNGPGVSPKQRPLRRFVATWDFNTVRADELPLCRGDILLVAEEFDDGWMRGLKLEDLEIGFFPACFVAQDTSPIYKLQEINLSTEHYINDPKFVDCDTSKRSKIAQEIFSSEEAYLEKMRMLNERFLVPLALEHTVITPEDYSPVFSNLQPLLSLSESIWVQLKSRMEAWDERFTRVGDVFLHMGHHLKLFVTYAVQHTLGSQILAKISTQEKFKNWLQKTEMQCQHSQHSKNSTLNSTLNSLLLDPIQRVPRYKLLLEDLIKHTPEEHPDFYLLREALNIVQKTASDINENIRRAENELKLFAISKRFPNDDVNIVSAKKTFIRHKDKQKSFRKRISYREHEPAKDCMSVRSFFESEHHRIFVKEGLLHKTKQDFTDPSERYLFLCSDVLLIAQLSSRSHKTYRLKERVMLVHAWITDTVMAEGKIVDRGFVLGTPRRTYSFIASSVEEKNAWFQQLQLRIFGQKKLFNQLLSHLSVPDEVYECCKVKARVSYLGMQQDELSFRSGDEIAIVGFKNGTNKWRPGLYAQEPFNPSPEWFFGVLNESFGWFPIQCVETKPLEPTNEELYPTPMCTVLSLKQRMMELTGRLIPPLTENQRMAKVFLGEGNFKTLRIPPESTVDEVVRMYFKVKPDSSLAWSLIEQSTDTTVHRLLEAQEDPSQVVDFWGKSRDLMRFLLKQSIINSAGDSEA